MARKLLAPLASLHLTIGLMALAMVLIFIGTLAQVQLGIWETVDTYFRSPMVWIDPRIFVPPQLLTASISIPFPGGMTIGGLLLINLLAAHAMRFKLSSRRIGVLILHAGLIVLLAGEFVTALKAEEGMMTIDVGSSSRYVEDIRTVELAVIDPSDPEVDQLVLVPEARIKRALKSGELITDEALPFDIRIDHWISNSRLLRADGATPADRGLGREAVPETLAPVRGVDGAQTDAPSAYVTLLRDGEPLGTWLLYVNLIRAQEVKVDIGDDQTRQYGIALRYQRKYKPYTIHLLEFRHEQFVGTRIPRNFASRVRIEDPKRGVDREVMISMNNPLRYAGATFYQASYKPDDSGSVLQVVRNPGAILPYIACILVGGGMIYHFVLGLTTFLQRRTRQHLPTRPRTTDEQGPTVASIALPWAAALLGIALALHALYRPAPQNEYDIETFSRLPVSAGGRVKPMDSVARHVLLATGGRQTVRIEEPSAEPGQPPVSRTVPAIEFLLDLMARPEVIRDYPLVRVDHPDVLALMDLKPEELGRLSLATIEPHWREISQQATAALDVPSRRRDSFQRSVVSLFARVNMVLEHSQMLAPFVVPPMHDDDEWQMIRDAAIGGMLPDGHPSLEGQTRRPSHPAVGYYNAMMTAYIDRKPEAFNEAVASYYQWLNEHLPRQTRRAHHEVLFSRASLFTGAMAVYVLAFLAAFGSMLLRLRAEPEAGGRDRAAEWLRLSAFGLIIGAAIIHTAAIALRIYLQGRPPVTNLYSSAVFVGWASVLLGLMLERIYPIGVAIVGAACVGFTTLVVAHHLGSDGDTMQMMQAVLDSNFWLATHVITITLGYSATFLAGALGMIYILTGVFTPFLTRTRAQTLGRMVYATVCFALLFSFVGTVLGGIWADQSWGRFWGWDPKENGAALVVLLNAIILHARWGGIVRLRGIMVLAVLGNIVTAWSWFGTNMLGIGLHSYGFMESGPFWMMAFVISQLLIISIGLIPTAGWCSERTSEASGQQSPVALKP
ncbi:MAG: cytochrome c biogenesis protein CcsA [Phycisphaeraceae bacterium]|nr:cytochrome c biogenesis protein CcsA [Phycisphaeraceae bacterium]